MKKLIVAILLGIVLTVISFSFGFANPGKVNFEGEISDVNDFERTLTVQNSEGEPLVFHFLNDSVFDFTSEDIGTWVHVKGQYQEDGSILVEWVKPLDSDSEEDEGKEESVYCSGEKDKPHPAALFLASTFSKPIEEIMGYFCDGFGFGQISLALQTEKISGVDYGTFLAFRAEGKGWGEIWDDLGYKGKPKDGEKKTPPGLDKHPDKDKDKDKGPDEKDEPKEKKPKKDKKPKKNK